VSHCAFIVVTGFTFATCAATLCILALIKYFLWESKSVHERLNYGALLSDVKARVFLMYLLSLFAWNLSLLFLNQVKAGGKEFDGSQTAFLCICTVTCVTMVLVGWYAKSLNVRASSISQQGSSGDEDDGDDSNAVRIRISVASQRPSFVTVNPLMSQSARSARFRDTNSNIHL
jgi:hypothetical protein